MHDRRRPQVNARNLERKLRLVCCGALASVVLAACGGGGDSPVAAAVDAASNEGAGAGTPGNSSGPPSADVAPSVPSGGDAPPADVAGPGASNAGSPPADAESSTEGQEARVSAAKGSITLNWTPPTLYEDGTPLKLTGYRIYWGAAEGHYPHSVTLTNPGLTRYVIEQLPPATWHFVATALSPEGESSFSNVFSMKVR
jgi:hypothetical protein